MSRDALSRKIASFESGLQRMGCFDDDFPSPTIDNDIHPVFHYDRWMKGYGQHTREIYDRMKTALRLASLMLTEDCMLWWWAHLDSGVLETARDESGRRFTYMEKTPAEFTRGARAEARKKLRDMADVVVFMFTPRRYEDSKEGRCWGVTRHRDMRPWPWSRHFDEDDYPYISRRHLRDPTRVPEITIKHEFQEFYMTLYRQYSRGQRLRVQFMFATTLVHEVAHAFYMYIGYGHHREEPHWNRIEKRAELGFSWELAMLGRVCDPLFHTVRNCHALFCVKTYLWHPEDRLRASEADRAKQIFYTCEGGIEVYQIPIDANLRWVPTHHWRGVDVSVEKALENPVNFLCIVHGVPMRWIAEWFSEAEWDKRRRTWREALQHERPQDHRMGPKLGPSWSLIYEKDVWGRESMYVASW